LVEWIIVVLDDFRLFPDMGGTPMPRSEWIEVAWASRPWDWSLNASSRWYQAAVRVVAAWLNRRNDSDLSDGVTMISELCSEV